MGQEMPNAGAMRTGRSSILGSGGSLGSRGNRGWRWIVRIRKLGSRRRGWSLVRGHPFKHIVLIGTQPQLREPLSFALRFLLGFLPQLLVALLKTIAGTTSHGAPLVGKPCVHH